MKWQEVTIKECGEKLVPVTGPRVFARPAYREMGYRQATEEIWLRNGSMVRLRMAAALLPAGFSLVAWDGWRPLSLQTELFEKYRAELSSQGLSGHELELETLRFVSHPSEDPLCPPPHLTGGTIDVTLGDEQGRELDMGGEFDELTERSGAFFYEGKDSPFRDRRRLLRQVMITAGWSSYPEEWWHFDFGNQFHHARRGGEARYGAADLSGPFLRAETGPEDGPRAHHR